MFSQFLTYADITRRRSSPGQHVCFAGISLWCISLFYSILLPFYNICIKGLDDLCMETSRADGGQLKVWLSYPLFYERHNSNGEEMHIGSWSSLDAWTRSDSFRVPDIVILTTRLFDQAMASLAPRCQTTSEITWHHILPAEKCCMVRLPLILGLTFFSNHYQRCRITFNTRKRDGAYSLLKGMPILFALP